MLTKLRTTGATIEVKVGPVEAPAVFYVHQKLVCNSSGYFRNISKSFDSALSNMWVVTLPNVEAKTFRAYLHWLYTGNVDPISMEKGYTLDLARDYVLGEKIIDPEFQNVSLDRIIQCRETRKECPGHRAVSVIYEGTPKGSPARRLMVDFHSYDAYDAWLDMGLLSRIVSAEFKDDLIAALITRRPPPAGPGPWKTNASSYHIDTVKTKTESSD